jgi:uncharacterized protein (TIGR02145 family)
MKKSIYLFFCISVYLSVSLNGQVINSQEEKENAGIKPNAFYNLEEIKVRWKKAALENCPGVPCIVAPPPPSFTCGTNTISDIDNNTYNTVSINTQCWTVTNLRVRRYNNGTQILFDASGGSSGSSTTWQNLTIGAHTIYANDSVASPSNLTTYGYLYNWYAAKGIFRTGVIASTDTLNICPSGWHVPSDEEWTTLTTFLGSSAGGKMKSTSSLWNSPNTGADNMSRFTALPGGFRAENVRGSFKSIGAYTYFWSATDNGSLDAWYRSLFNADSLVGRTSGRKFIGSSVRCLMN